MVQRLATIYHYVQFHLSFSQLGQFREYFRRNQVQSTLQQDMEGHVIITITLNGKRRVFPFTEVNGSYHYHEVIGSIEPQWEQLLRPLIAQFNGNAMVKRVYAGFAMMYVYEQGQIAEIVEVKPNDAHVVYQHLGSCEFVNTTIIPVSTNAENGHLDKKGIDLIINR